MMQVRGPTGIVIRFPDGTDPATIDRVMREAVAKQQPAASSAPVAPEQPPRAANAAEYNGAMVGSMVNGGEPAPNMRPPETFGDRFQTLDSGVRSLTSGVPILGAVADRIDPQPEQDAAFQRDHPVLSTALPIVGGIASLGGAAAAVPGAAAALGMKGPALLRPFLGGATGAALSGGDAAIRGGDVGKAVAIGGALGAAGPIVGNVVGRVAGNRAARSAIPSVEERANMGHAAFEEAKQAGVGIGSRSVRSFATGLANEVRASGYRPALHPGIKDALAAMDEIVAKGPMTLEDAHYLRRVFQAAGKDMNNLDQGRLAGQMVDKIDDYLSSLKPTDVIMGDPVKGPQLLKAGIDNWRIMRKSELVQGLYERARNAAGANYTNAGMETALRQQFRKLADNHRQLASFSKEEQAAILKVVRGDPVQNAWRLLGKFAPSGLVSATLSGGAGYALGGPVGSAAIMGAGQLGKSMATRATMRNAGIVDAMVRAGGQMPAAAPGAGQGAAAATTGALQSFAIPTIPRWAMAPVPQVPVQR